ncbi:MAG: YcaO-like family protein [Nostoc sp.]|uniref:YcaO-like family protein n=1 Tax=Nostoc sp. TaxID=1180 RepID=UPI002FF4E539
MTQQSVEAAPISSINFRGKAYRAGKRFWHGTHRTASPEETLERVRPYFKSIGLTRLCNITGLDRIGIPVTLAVRPNSYSIVTSSGKGTTLQAALASAAMESIELYCAENIRLPEIYLPYTQLASDYQSISLEDLPLRKNSLFSVHQLEQWVLGWDLVNQKEVAVPVQAVSMDYRFLYEDLTNLASFDMSSNGLASGNHFLEAVSSALFELIERDAISCNMEAAFIGYHKPRVRLETIEYPAVLELLAQFKAAQVVPILFDCTVNTEVPVYQAYCYDQTGYVTISHGYGAHLDPEVAMIRALTEAAQTRAILISGARDDVFQQYYAASKITGSEAEVQRLESHPPTVNARIRKSQATPTFEGDILVVLEKLQQVGLNQVIVFDLSPPEWEIAVARVIVPGLEGYFYRNYLPKHRAITFAKSKQSAMAESTKVIYNVDTHLPAGGVF